MKRELVVLAITSFFILNAYNDGKYMKYVQDGQKYIKMIGIAFAGMSIYLYMKKSPENSRSFIQQATNVVRFMPSGSEIGNYTKYLDMTSGDGYQSGPSPSSVGGGSQLPEDVLENRLKSSGKQGGTKRSVSETKKKYVAANQNWKCQHCQNQLPAWFEVDHITRLEFGGSNNVDNLVALCRDCHGKKTAMEKF